MARLANTSVDEVQASRLDVARDFAVQHQIYVVLKGYRTLIATPDGKVFINPLGNPGMATGGTGDVLTGVLAAWLAQLLDAEAACKIARVPARARRRPDGGRRRRSGDDGGRPRGASRRRRARADRPPAREAVQWPVLRSSRPIPNSETFALGEQSGGDAARPERSCCCTAISARARRRSCAAWPPASAPIPTTSRARRSCSFSTTRDACRSCTSTCIASKAAPRSTIWDWKRWRAGEWSRSNGPNACRGRSRAA